MTSRRLPTSWIRRWSRITGSTGRRRPRLIPELRGLEGRMLLSITIQVNYSEDTNNFFNTQAKRDLMQAAANSIAGALNDTLLAIQPSGSNTWTAEIPNPSGGAVLDFPNLVVPANTLILYVGARPLPGNNEAGEGSTSGIKIANGDTAWLNTVQARGKAGVLASPPTAFGPWGGAISFDNSGSTHWYFGQDTSGLGANQIDFYTVALHELGHVLGIGTSASWQTYVSGTTFIGPAAEAANGGHPVPLDPGLQHWAEGTTSGGAKALMDPIILDGTRELYTPLDEAGLQDVGWVVQPTPLPSVFQLAGSTDTVGETSGSVTIVVTRTGGSDPASVQYATSNGTARAGIDYTATSGTLNFAAGQTLQSFSIPILQDPQVDGNETINVLLRSPSSNSTLGNPASAVVTIVEPGRHPLGDFDGVGYTEPAVFRAPTAQWIIDDPHGGHAVTFGAPNLFDIPVPGNYDGTGLTEEAVFRPSTGQWIILNPSTGTQRVVNFGAPNLFDIPAPGDYDGIGRTEPAVFRPSTGQWIVLNPLTMAQRVVTFGAPNLFDIPAPGDYDGIGRTEMAVFRPSAGEWIVLNPTNGSQRGVFFGTPNLVDIPAPGDYDGVGRTEMAVYRASTAQWIISNPTNGSQRAIAFGTANFAEDYPAEASIASLIRLRPPSGASMSASSAAIRPNSAAIVSTSGVPAGPSRPATSPKVAGNEPATASRRRNAVPQRHSSTARHEGFGEPGRDRDGA